MVKKFNVSRPKINTKIKFPSRSGGNDSNNNNNAEHDSAAGTSSTTPASSASNARAEYYAARNNNSNSNPFNNGGGGGGSRPAAPKTSNSNPFGDDSDDDDDDAVLAGFARKKPPPAAASSQRSAPPPAGGNPFGNDDDDDDDDPPPSYKKSNNNNPFGDDDDDDEQPPQQHQRPRMSKGRSTRAEASNNPFGNDNDDSNESATPTSTRGMSRSSSIRPSAASSTNPFGETSSAGPTLPAAAASAGHDPFLGEMNAKTLPQFHKGNSSSSSIDDAAPGRRRSPQQQQQQQSSAGGRGGGIRPNVSARPPPPPRPPSAARGGAKPKLESANGNTTNPFNDDGNKPSTAGSGDDDNRPPSVPKPLISRPPSQRTVQITRSAPPGNGGNNHPFFDNEHATNTKPSASSAGPAKKRWLNMGGGGGGNCNAATGDGDSTRPILAGMDEESTTLATNTNTNNTNNNGRVPTLQQQQQQGGMQGGNSNNAAGLASWLRRNKNEDEVGGGGGGTTNVGGNGNKEQTNHSSAAAARGGIKSNAGDPPPTTSQNHASSKPKRRKKKTCRISVTPWPFDSYHEVQEQMYEELASRAASEYSALGGYSSDNDDEKKDDARNKRTPGRGRKGQGSSIGGGGMGGGNAHHAADASKYYERPEELLSLKEAVNDLSLVDFEKKAEERAINIVSTWLFDAGLIDELLVNGAMGPTPLAHPQHHQQQQQQQPKSNATVASEKTSEGQEIGVNGFLVGAEGAEVKMDKETNKLRAMIQRDLSIINARLNDGVAASGLEVQELVNAVSATKDDIGRLRELTTYISDGQISDRDEFLLAKYPYLRKAINARRNLNRCFRELEFFSHIPSTCERLRDDLHGGEWTAEEWATIRNVSMEHVELEVMLVEAEASMKGGAHNFGDAQVDNFLDSHVQNVWELGEEIRMRIISGVGSAFELSMNNPAGMVALVEAVEVYERAAETFEKKRNTNGGVGGGGDNGDSGGERLRFTNMRAAALEQLYQDFELRGVDMFREVHENAADEAEEEDAANAQFTGVLKAATELVTEIDIVKHQMSPCFAPHWHVEALWSSCVAHVCSNHIVQQIGGPDGQNLPELSITQLLELVAWVEYFRETIEETFPEVASMRDTKKTYFVEERPELFAGDKRTVNMTSATESLAWVNNMLWEVHRLAQEEFLVRTRTQTDEWLDKVYGSEPVKNQSAEGILTTSICEDVFSFSSVQLRTIRERLSKKSDALILAVCIILSHMRSKQVHARNNFLQDLETCCAASNDFTRMSEKCEDMISELMSQCEFSEDMMSTVEATSNELMGVYSSDAVYSSRSVHIYVFDPIEEEIGIRFFEEDWEETMVDNDLAISLVRTLEDFHEDLEHYMDDFMVVKSMLSLMSATVIFYVKCLLQRAEKHRNNKRPYFGDVKKALDRMTGDIKVMRDYFEGLVPKMPSLKKNIEKNFEILDTIHELMCIASGFSESDAEDFIIVLQKRVRDVGITKHIVADLWHLVAPTEERYVWELVESMEELLVAIAPADEALALEVNDRSYVKGLRLDEMAVKLYVKSRRNRPIKATAVESIVTNWRTTWSAGAEDAYDEE